jgi:hypothetical protein
MRAPKGEDPSAYPIILCLYSTGAVAGGISYVFGDDYEKPMDRSKGLYSCC